MFFFIDKIDNNGWYSIPEWTPFRADYIILCGKKMAAVKRNYSTADSNVRKVQKKKKVMVH